MQRSWPHNRLGQLKISIKYTIVMDVTVDIIASETAKKVTIITVKFQDFISFESVHLKLIGSIVFCVIFQVLH